MCILIIFNNNNFYSPNQQVFENSELPNFHFKNSNIQFTRSSNPQNLL